ncbi:hypothetical protein EXIGLDRAFT_720866 [Exidia glandulosa HHB12029]|uniref:F-box domain-containing protein n=1 Tax=Exidia glandulosa HHB12029 TaxID=1314781 RepID=A0A165NEH5_EXIGL|nr:hypothetical protein EXIGLDRAFT_720866 [Exidia glandulosa HHB12029]
MVLPAPLLVPPTSPLPRLPIELWECVFSLATEEHILKAFFSTPTDAPFTAPRVSDFMLEYVYLQSAATMRSCALVNREWSDRAVQYLYRYIWLRSASDAELLARTLAPSFRRSNRIIRLQHLVQNVLVRFPKERVDDSPPTRSYGKKLAAVLRNTPNLSVFLHSDTQDASVPRKASRALAAVASLWRAEWTTTAHSAIITSSSSLRDLRSLTLQCPGMPSHPDLTPPVELELPHLHTLSIAFCRHQALSAAGKWRMPALRHLSVCRCSVLGAAFGPKASDLTALLMRVGPRLDQLDLNCAMGGVALDLRSTCPRLRTLLVSSLSLPAIVAHPYLELVGLHQPIGFAPPPAEMDALLTLLYCLQESAMFPRLRTVRYLIPAQAVKRLSQHPGSGLRSALEAISVAGIIVEDVGRNTISFARPGLHHRPSEDYWDVTSADG